MDWLRGHMRAHITSPGSAKPAAEDILLKYRRPVIVAETRNGHCHVSEVEALKGLDGVG
jgi:hypothetical protein